MSETLESTKAAASHCTACPLYANATQTVFGEGAADAKLMLVGEQPGDKEDIAGRPFVGPAGKLLDRCLEEAGIDRRQTYVTNAVKHFKWVHSSRICARPHAPWSDWLVPIPPNGTFLAAGHRQDSRHDPAPQSIWPARRSQLA